MPKRKYAVLVFFISLSSLSTFADEPLKQEPWQTDFSKFLTFTEELNKQDPINLENIKEKLLSKNVQWRGTFKYLWKNKPHFLESFVSLDEDTKMARAMFYANADDLNNWKQVIKGAEVGYAGVITDVKIETVIPSTPFIYVEVHQVKIINETE